MHNTPSRDFAACEGIRKGPELLGIRHGVTFKILNFKEHHVCVTRAVVIRASDQLLSVQSLSQRD